MVPQQTIQQVFSTHPLFRGAGAASRPLASRAVVRRVDAGQLLCGEHQRTGNVWFLADGLLHATIQSSSGSPVTVGVLKPGEVYGYLSCWDDGGHAGHTEDLCGLVDASVVGVPAPLFVEYVASHQSAAQLLLRETAERVRALMRLRAISTEPAGQRVRSVLAFLHDKLGAQIPMTRSMIACVAGLTTETVSRSMAPLARRKVIVLRRGVVEIRDLAALHAQ